MATLAGLYVYPIKALDALEVDSATVGPGGSLALDRRYAMVDDDGAYINGKRTAAVHRLRADFDEGATAVTVGDAMEAATFSLPDELSALAEWLDGRFEPPVSVIEDDDLGYPDDTTDSGPTVISTGTLETMTEWFDEVADPTEMRRRLRPNLVVEAEPFWEDRLYAAPGESQRFHVGDVPFDGTSPCQRCVVPQRHPDTGEEIAGFQKAFVENREESLPSWANREQFDHFFRVMVNTVTPESAIGSRLEVGEPVTIA